MIGGVGSRGWSGTRAGGARTVGERWLSRRLRAVGHGAKPVGDRTRRRCLGRRDRSAGLRLGRQRPLDRQPDWRRLSLRRGVFLLGQGGDDVERASFAGLGIAGAGGADGGSRARGGRGEDLAGLAGDRRRRCRCQVWAGRVCFVLAPGMGRTLDRSGVGGHRVTGSTICRDGFRRCGLAGHGRAMRDDGRRRGHRGDRRNGRKQLQRITGRRRAAGGSVSGKDKPGGRRENRRPGRLSGLSGSCGDDQAGDAEKLSRRWGRRGRRHARHFGDARSRCRDRGEDGLERTGRLRGNQRVGRIRGGGEALRLRRGEGDGNHGWPGRANRGPAGEMSQAYVLSIYFRETFEGRRWVAIPARQFLPSRRRNCPVAHARQDLPYPHAVVGRNCLIRQNLPHPIGKICRKATPSRPAPAAKVLKSKRTGEIGRLVWKLHRAACRREVCPQNGVDGRPGREPSGHPRRGEPE